jgi:(p)ppGpp synthase/HD superfamily hydrolase
MTVLTRPRHPVVAGALNLAHAWCAGHLIDGAPALGHAVKVALTLGRHISDPAPELVAAVLLHDSPEFAPPEVDLDTVLAARFGAPVARIVRALEREHLALDQRAISDVAMQDLWVLYVSTADKIVSLESILRRAARAPDAAAYWDTRPTFVARVPYFAAFHATAARHLPPGMSSELGRLVARAEQATAPLRP